MSSSKMDVKVYVVLQHQNLPLDGEPNRMIIAVKLTREAAQKVVNDIPGTYIEKHRANKH